MLCGSVRACDGTQMTNDDLWLRLKACRVAATDTVCICVPASVTGLWWSGLKFNGVLAVTY